MRRGPIQRGAASGIPGGAGLSARRGRGPAAAGAGGLGRRGRGPAHPRRLTRARVAALLGLAVAVALVWFLLSLFQPFAGAVTAG